MAPGVPLQNYLRQQHLDKKLNTAYIWQSGWQHDLGTLPSQGLLVEMRPSDSKETSPARVHRVRTL